MAVGRDREVLKCGILALLYIVVWTKTGYHISVDSERPVCQMVDAVRTVSRWNNYLGDCRVVYSCSVIVVGARQANYDSICPKPAYE